MRNSNARQPNEALASETRSFRMPKLRFSREVFRLGNPGNTKHAQTGLTISAASAAAIRRLSARRRRNTSTRSVWAEGCERYDRRTDRDHTIRRARADDQRSLGSGGRHGGQLRMVRMVSPGRAQGDTVHSGHYLQATTATASISTSHSGSASAVTPTRVLAGGILFAKKGDRALAMTARYSGL